VSLVYPGGRLLPLKLRAVIDLVAPRLKLAVSAAPIAPVSWDKPRRPPDNVGSWHQA
jgi:hypothetical protein